MRVSALLALLVLSGCVGFARGDGQGNVEVVTNWGSFGGAAEETPEKPVAEAAQ
ncbi:hypothetical protein ACRDNQ_14435 [Palleronia sp. KMU-117]|uniref:hypothetical protein n=1 Tax=Palleronia sp. KMU-117 TaxID=3434108 RepID=UPI003D73A885